MKLNADGTKEPATLTMRYSPLITPQCRIKKAGDTEPFEIISMNDVRTVEWLEIKGCPAGKSGQVEQIIPP